RKKNIGKPDEGKPHVRFDAGGAGKVKGGLAPSDEISVLYSTWSTTFGLKCCLGTDWGRNFSD
ncbi:hypothetical protein, partial [Paenibacillus sp.]|uniref:hypothetical protein n=1 Tax=Paenibacillus sp. TaxID=58172 RepID=UPI00356AD7D9